MSKDNKDNKDEKDDKQDKQDDIFQYPIARFTGAYVSEVTNDLVCISPLFYTHSCWIYKIRPTYILLDCLHKGVRAYEADDGNGIGKGLIAAGDRYVWHLLASVLLPSLSLNYLRMGLNKLFSAICLNKDMKKSLITLAIIGTIPLILQPLDQVAEHIVDNSYRQIYSDNNNKSTENNNAT